MSSTAPPGTRGEPGAGRPCVFIGGSAGAIEVLVELLPLLSPDLSAAVLITLHVGRTGTSVLPMILDRVGGIHVVTPEDGEVLANGTVYVAPRGQHMVAEGGRVRLQTGPTEHGVRPAIDPLFRSAARSYGPKAIGVIVSGMLDDGVAGLREIKAHGGWTLVQDPREAAFPSMPESAIAHVDVDYVLPVAGLAACIQRLVSAPPRRSVSAPGPMAKEHARGLEPSPPPGMETDVTCPLCGGVLWEEIEDRLTTYRCRSGHVYSPQSLLSVQGDGLDSAIWRPIRIMTERGALLHRLSERAEQQGRGHAARMYSEQAVDALRRASELRRAAHSDPATRAGRDDDPDD